MLSRPMALFTIVIIAFLASFSAPAASAEREIIDPRKVCPNAEDKTLKIDSKEVCTLLVVVRNTLEQLKDRVPETPKLTSVTLNLKAGTKREAGGEISIS